MKQLEIQKLSDANELKDFYCGIDTIDDFLHGDFKDYLYLGICKAFVVKESGNVVAMYSLDKFNVYIGDDVKSRMQEA